MTAFKKRNMFLNGRLFLRTKRDWAMYDTELGAVMFNLFYYDTDDYPSKNAKEWYGLSKTRILQSLRRNDVLSADTIMHQMTKWFSYPEALISQDIENLRAFGLIDTKLIGCDSIVYEISEKGRRFFDDVFCDIDTLYYFALDSYIPERLIYEGFINAHDNKFMKKTHFPFASITTTLAFLFFLTNISILEIQKLKKLRKPEIILQDWQLPCYDKNLFSRLIDSFHMHIEKAEDNEKCRVMDNIEKLSSAFWKNGN